MAENDPLWFKDAVFYQLHVKAFADSDGDGVGDFKGLTEKLDYVKSLGVDTLWLLPFYPSPLKDDGYDIAEYRGIHPMYGTMRDFRQFVREAHDRGLRVVTELVVNHTSDQHPWFQRARAAKPGSAARDYYVWSQTHEKYADTRIIFTDTEKSNWAWDDEAGAYYWHRFFSHQPDLNYANPRVVREVINVMRFWLDMGVDGMRLDAVPYLCEREGTNNENLPETHAILKQLRAALDESHQNRIFLAEANQWPEDVQHYFGAGEGDECHMAYHFPLMPRMFMALAREDRHPITDIMRQTPEPPEKCQWAIFLRNHDELTLEMVTSRERDYLWDFYAADLRSRVNVGIRRRLAPLMDNDRRKIELLNSLLLSMPGTPIIYYGDELGMGDNIYLGDRNGVRTPMQWSEDRNGGFSRSDPARLYLPVIMDPVYGYRSVNVEAQLRSPSSLLNWMRRMIAIRQGRKTFGRGTIRFLYPANRKILAYLREHEGDVVLCVANLSSTAQGVELDLSEFENRVPVELTGPSPFPPIGELPYFLTLPAYAFYWFKLSEETEAPYWHEPFALKMPELVTLVIPGTFESLYTGAPRRCLEKEVLRPFLRAQRWFADKDAIIESAEILRHYELRSPEGVWSLALVGIRRADGIARDYLLPLGMAWEDDEDDDLLSHYGGAVIARLRWGPKTGVLYDASANDAFVLALVEASRMQWPLAGPDGGGWGFATRAMNDIGFDEVPPSVRRFGVEQSNTSVLVGDQVVVKLLRRPEEGPHPEYEMADFLTNVAHYTGTPRLLGGIASGDSARRATMLVMLYGYVANQGDAWTWVTDHFARVLNEIGALPEDEWRARLEGGLTDDTMTLINILGQRTAELHKALCLTTGDPDFDPDPVDRADLDFWRARALDQAGKARRALVGDASYSAQMLADRWDEVETLLGDLVPVQPEGVKTRLHGDYHLGQVLVVKNDVQIIDFEGEPGRSMAGRRGKDSAMRDVAGMLRSFNYAAWSTLFQLAAVRPETLTDSLTLAKELERLSAQAFLAGYDSVAAHSPCQPGPEARERLRTLFLLEKACYEITYEAANRPNWLQVPIKGILELIDAKEE